ncbi:MAG: thioredoxin [Eubacterium sp.]|nr:thioredoxin [Eubacterium sp.]
MKTIAVTKETFEAEVLKSDKPVIVDFWAEWCGPCKMLSPIVDKVAEANDDIKVCKVDVDTNQELAMEYKTMSIPTLIAFKDGSEYKRSVGVISKSEILDLVK